MHKNFVKFIKTRPPLVLFTICLLLFTIVLSFLNQYIKYHDVSNPDNSQDWNEILKSFSTLEFCLSSNKTHRNHDLRNEITNKDILMRSMTIVFKMQPALNILATKSQLVNTFLTGKQLGLKGIYAEQQVNLSFILPVISEKDVQCYFNKTCLYIDVISCAVFRTLIPMFPNDYGPDHCPADKMRAIENSKSILYLTWHRKETLFRYLSCSRQTSFKTEYRHRSEFTVMLSKTEISVISDHIYICVCILIVLISLILLYGVTYGYRDLSCEVIQYN